MAFTNGLSLFFGTGSNVETGRYMVGLSLVNRGLNMASIILFLYFEI